MLKRAFLSGLILLGAVLPLPAQEPSDTLWAPTNRLSAGVGITSLGLSPLIFSMYSRSISPDVELEASLQNSSWSSFQLARDQSIIGVNRYGLSVGNVITIDGTALFSLKDRRKDIHYNSSQLRFGGGLSLQFMRSGGGTIYQITKAATPIDSVVLRPWNLGGSLREEVYFGGNVKIDYLLPLSQMLDLGVRAQAHLSFSIPEPGVTFFYGDISLSAFASVRF